MDLEEMKVLHHNCLDLVGATLCLRRLAAIAGHENPAAILGLVGSLAAAITMVRLRRARIK
jgi:hypothetical protein